MLAAHPGGAGLEPWFRYEKYRSTYRLPGLPGVKVELDETPIGDFLEVEGAARGIDRAAGCWVSRRPTTSPRAMAALFHGMAARGRGIPGQRARGHAERFRDMLFSQAERMLAAKRHFRCGELNFSEIRHEIFGFLVHSCLDKVRDSL